MRDLSLGVLVVYGLQSSQESHICVSMRVMTGSYALLAGQVSTQKHGDMRCSSFCVHAVDPSSATSHLLHKRVHTILSCTEKFMSGRSGKIEDGVDVDPRDVKIKELAKKTRKMGLDLQKEKDKSSTAERDVERLVAELQAAQDELEDAKASPALAAMGARARAEAGAPSPSKGGSNPGDSAKIKHLHERLTQATTAAELAKAQLQVAHKAMQAEIGPDVDIADVIASVSRSAAASSAGTTGLAGSTTGVASSAAGGGWRGRAQRISLLKNKVKKLERRLAQGRGGDSEAGTPSSSTATDVNGAPIPGAGGGGSAGHGVDAAARQHVAEMGSQRSKAMEMLTSENDELRQVASDAQRKVDAGKARLRVMEIERKKTQQQLSTLLSKTDNDDKLIGALRAQLGRMEVQVSDAQRAASEAAAGGSVLYAGSRPLGGAASSVQHSAFRDGPGSPGSIGPSASVAGASQHGGGQAVAAAHAEAQRLGALATDQGRRLHNADRVIGSLKQEIASLRSQLGSGGAGGSGSGGGMASASSSRPGSADVRHMAGLEVAAQETDAKNRMLVMQVGKLQEAAAAAERRAAQAEGTIQSYIQRSSALEARCRELESAGATAGPADAPAALAAQLATLRNQEQAVAMQHASALAARDAAVAQMQQHVNAITGLWERFSGDVRQRLAGIGVMLPGGAPPASAGGSVASSMHSDHRGYPQHMGGGHGHFVPPSGGGVRMSQPPMGQQQQQHHHQHQHQHQHQQHHQQHQPGQHDELAQAAARDSSAISTATPHMRVSPVSAQQPQQPQQHSPPQEALKSRKHVKGDRKKPSKLSGLPQPARKHSG